MMKSLSILFLLMITSTVTLANDGAFFARGNQLIPISETDIAVRKEILTLKKVKNQYIEVTVYYEFFNPKEAKNITVGFEAFSPEGDVDGAPKNGQHPYMRDFTVELNSQKLKYNVAYVSDSLYNNAGKIKQIDLKTFQGNISGNTVDFFYVYHFQAHFKKGLNIIKHTYKYDVSGSIDYNYDFEYVLSAAKRWGNHQIDDFTLIIDNGDFETFSIDKTFFKNSQDWKIEGVGKTEDVKGTPNAFVERDALKFHIQKGKVIFKKMNFIPNENLFVYAQNILGYEDLSYLPQSVYQTGNIAQPKTEFQRKLLKNLPFARRGYIFQNPELKSYFENIDWYIPNPQYTADFNLLIPDEKNWYEKWK